MGSKNPWADWAQIFLVVGVHDVITTFKFGDDRFRGVWLAEGQILPFSIDFEDRPYNTQTIVWNVIIMTVTISICSHPFSNRDVHQNKVITAVRITMRASNYPQLMPALPDTFKTAYNCLLYTSDAADDLTRVDLGGRRIIKKKKKK